MKTCLVLLLALAACSAVQADPTGVTLTFTATADASGYGYTSGVSYTFSYTTGASYPTADSFDTTTFNGSSNVWGDNDDSDPALWTSIGGTGLLGTYTRDADTVSVLTSASTYTQITAYNPSLDNGLRTLSGATLNNAYVYIDGSVANPTFSGSYVSPAAYFSSRTGDYATSGSSIRLYYTSGDWVNFTVTNFNVSSAAAVPEPATYAALAGLGAFGVALWRKRRAR